MGILIATLPSTNVDQAALRSARLLTEASADEWRDRLKLEMAELAAGSGRYPRPMVSLNDAEWVWRELAVQALREDCKPEIVRLAVIAGLVRSTGARYGDLIRLRAEDLDLGPLDEDSPVGEGTAVVSHGKHRTERVHKVPPQVVVILRRWMDVRVTLCEALEGSLPRPLLLTVHHTHDNGTTVSSGLPITKQGLVLSWRRHVARTNARNMGDTPILPARFEPIRRAWIAAGLPDPGTLVRQ
ncbi:MAG: site-specific integrase [Cellulomonadaceae bacterium]|jgi:integrase|nr:site-specific integrase [Cellulomonadaceae bacterium]